MGTEAPKPVVTPIVIPVRCTPKSAPCPKCGKLGRRKRTCTRSVRTVAYKAIVYLEITYGEYGTRCDCSTTFRNTPEGVLPKAQYDNRVRDLVLERILQDGMSIVNADLRGPKPTYNLGAQHTFSSRDALILVGEFLEADRVSGSSEGDDFRWPRSLRKRDFASIRRLRNPSPDVFLDTSVPINTIRGWEITGNRPTFGGPIVDDSRCLRFFLEPTDTLHRHYEAPAPISSSGVP